MQIGDFIRSIEKNKTGDEPVPEPMPEPGIPAVTEIPQKKPVEGSDIDTVTTAPEQKKPDATYRHYFYLLKGGKKSALQEYDFERYGSLIEAQIPDNYELVDQVLGRTRASLLSLLHITNAQTRKSTSFLNLRSPILNTNCWNVCMRICGMS